ncbi:hypothetical protein AB0C76_33050 [Kitasatospora sp. NPDC048722]|uniref:hypothetical protein n=1 Tax=Kitasatospora sp. NPDC048722 TaxID=3155639 RepID=UPI003404F987
MSRGRAAGIRRHRELLSRQQASELVLAAHGFDTLPAEVPADAAERCEQLRTAYRIRRSHRLPAAPRAGAHDTEHDRTPGGVTS